MLAASYPPSLFTAPYIGSWLEWTTNCMFSRATATFPNALGAVGGFRHSMNSCICSKKKLLGWEGSVLYSVLIFVSWLSSRINSYCDNASDIIVLTSRSHPGLNSNREKPTNHSEPGIASVIAFCNLVWTTLANMYADLKINSCGGKSFCNLRQNSGAITISMVSQWPGGSPCPAICTSTLCKDKQPITPWRSVGRERSRSQYGFSCDVQFFHSSDWRSEPSPHSRTRIGMQRPLLQSCASSDSHCFHIIN